MDTDIILFIEKLQLMIFFLGYPLLFTFLYSFKNSKESTFYHFLHTLYTLLPSSYFLLGLLFVGLVFKNLFPDYSVNNFFQQFKFPYLTFWASSSLIFCIGFLNKRPIYSLLHSLVFFSLLLKDFFSATNDIIRNDMKIYTISLLINSVCLLLLFLINLLFKCLIKVK